MRTRRTRGLGAIIAIAALVLTGMVALGTPASAAIDCDLHPESPLCNGGGPIDPCELNPTQPGCTEPEPCEVVNISRPWMYDKVRVGATVDARNGEWTGADSYSYRWLLAGTPVGTQPYYIPQPGDQGKPLVVEVTGAADCDATGTAESDPITVGKGHQQSTSTQTVLGWPATVGSPLSVIRANTTGIGEPTVSFEWRVGGVAVAEGTYYTPQSADLGKRLDVIGHYDRVGYDRLNIDTVLNDAVQPAAAANNSSAPTVTGSARYGGTLTVTPGVWSLPGAVSYQWLRNGIPIAGATGMTYRPTLADIGNTIAVVETNAPAGHEAADSTSAAVRIALAGKLAHKSGKKKPALKGKHKVGKVLKVRQAKKKLKGWFTPAAARVSFQWLRDGKVIKKATKAKYRLRRADRRHKISVRVIAVKPGYANGAWKSKAVRVR